MLAEGVHSLVDTLNQVLLLVGLARAKKKPDARHPFGYGREVYFYAFVVALLIFLVGGLYSAYQGIEKILHPEPSWGATIFGVKLSGLTINLAILGFAIVAEGYSFLVALRALPGDGEGAISIIRRSKDPSLFVVLVEDFAALCGLVLALAGVILANVFDLPVLDGAASVAIGILLVAMAVFLMVETHGLLIGEAADPEVAAKLKQLVRREPDVRGINEILTQQLGPKDILVNVSLDIRNDASGRDLEALVGRLDRGLKQACRDVRHVFVEIQAHTGARRRS